MPVATEWIPVLAAACPAPTTGDTFRCAHERDSVLADIETRAARRGLQPLRWPEPFPFDSALAMRAATYAKRSGAPSPSGSPRSARRSRAAARSATPTPS